MKPTQISVTISEKQKFILDANLSFLIWATIALLFPLLAIFKENVIPHYFFYDASTIDHFMHLNTPLTKGDSYASTAAFYNFFNISRDSVLFPIIASMIIIYYFFQVLKKSTVEKISILEFGMFFYYVLLCLIYMTLLSKDFIVMLGIIPFMFFSKRKVLGLFIWSALALFYGVYFRAYWFLILGLFWTLYFLIFFIRRPIYLFLLVLFFLFILAVVFQVGMGIDVDNFRTIVNDVRLDTNETNANSMITNVIPGGGLFISWLNVCLTWVFMMVPVPLILALSPYYLVISVLMILLYAKFWKAIGIALRNQSDPTMKGVICLLLSFTAIQSIFEPDYGSYVRHLGPFYPLFFYVIFASRRLNVRSANNN